MKNQEIGLMKIHLDLKKEKKMSSFVEVCIYEVKPEKLDEFEILINDVVEHHKSFP